MRAKASLEDKAGERTVRASVSFPREQYELLESVAKDKRVSVAWVVREAVEKYLADQWPLLERRGKRT
jgi:hypothetical protein